MESLYLDANILMEIIFQRPKAKKCLETISQAKNLFVSSLSVHIVMYYLEKDAPDLILDFQEILGEFFVLDLNSLVLQKAFNSYDFRDFEDFIQVTTCLESEIKNFLTLDKDLAKKHSDKLNITLL